MNNEGKLEKPKQQLGRVNAFRLADWIRANLETLKRDRLTLHEAADKATKDLGFPVRYTHIRSVRADLGITWASKPKERGSVPPSGHGTAKKIMLLTREVEGLCQAVQDLAKMLGVPSVGDEGFNLLDYVSAKRLEELRLGRRLDDSETQVSNDTPIQRYG